MKRITTLGLALGLGFALAGTASAQVKFGMAGPITGPSAATGAQMKNGVDQAAEDINKPAAFSARRSPSNTATTFPIPSRASRSPINSPATASSS